MMFKAKLKEKGFFIPLLTATIVLIITGCFGHLMLNMEKKFEQQQIRNLIYKDITRIESELHQSLQSRMYLVMGLYSYVIVNNGLIDPVKLRGIQKVIYDTGSFIINVGVAPANILKFIYPIKGNEKALGLVYKNNKAQWPAIKETIKSGKGRLVGPINLVQGGKAFIYRLPIFLKNNKYWGLLSVVFSIEHIFHAGWWKKISHKYSVAIRNQSGNILGNKALFTATAIMTKGNIAGMDIEIAIMPHEDQKKENTIFWIYKFLTALFVLGATISTFSLMYFYYKKEDARRIASTSLKKAKKASRAKSEFLAIMSHEIRTPLNAVLGFGELLAKTKLNPNQEEQVSNIVNSGGHLLGLINDILDFSKIEAGELTLFFSDCSLATVLDEINRIYSPLCEEKGVQFILNIDENISQQLFIVDQLRLKQILVNLISNAVKFTEKGKIELKVFCNPVLNGQMLIDFSVQDSGIGVKEEEQKLILNPFTQVDTNFTRRFGGTGLGLSITSQLLSLMDSFLEIESSEGKGSRFSFKLNLAVSQNSSISEQSEYHLSRPLHVLIAEDNAVNALMLKNFLKQAGCTFDWSKNGKSVLDKLGIEGEELSSENNFDIVLMDIQMPIMDGLEATRRIRASGQLSLPIIALTADVTARTSEACLAAGCDAHLGKPYSLQKLMQVLAKFS